MVVWEGYEGIYVGRWGGGEGGYVGYLRDEADFRSHVHKQYSLHEDEAALVPFNIRNADLAESGQAGWQAELVRKLCWPVGMEGRVAWRVSPGPVG